MKNPPPDRVQNTLTWPVSPPKQEGEGGEKGSHVAVRGRSGNGRDDSVQILAHGGAAKDSSHDVPKSPKMLKELSSV